MSDREPPKLVVCPRCGEEMRLAVTLPAKGNLPAVEGYRCDSCGIEQTFEVE